MRKVRIRCPICGMLVWQKRLHKDHKFEFVIQESEGRGYCKLEHKYHTARIADSPGAELFQFVLGLKLVYKGAELIKEVSFGDVEIEEGDYYISVVIKVDEDRAKEAEEELREEREELYEAEETKEIEEAEEVYEMELPGVEKEIELPTIYEEDVKFSLGKKLKRKAKRSKEIERGFEEIEREFELESVIEKEAEIEMEVE